MNSEKQSLNKISEELVTKAAVKAVLDIPGVNCLCDTFTDNLSKIIGARNPNYTGIKVSREKDKLNVDVFVICDYGSKIPQLAWDIQSVVKETVERVSDSKSGNINIHIQGVMMPEEGK